MLPVDTCEVARKKGWHGDKKKLKTMGAKENISLELERKWIWKGNEHWGNLTNV